MDAGNTANAQADNKQKFWFENWQFLTQLNEEHPLFFDLLQWALSNDITFKQFVALGTIIDKRLVAHKW